MQYEHVYQRLNLDQLKMLALVLAKNIEKDAIILLSGPIGSGKTTWSQFFINYFFPNLKVLSPTFTISLSYHHDSKGNELIINHFDFYRLNTVQEIFELFADQFTGKINLIEWAPSNFPFLDYSHHIYYIDFNYVTINYNCRAVKITNNHRELSFMSSLNLG